MPDFAVSTDEKVPSACRTIVPRQTQVIEPHYTIQSEEVAIIGDTDIAVDVQTFGRSGRADADVTAADGQQDSVAAVIVEVKRAVTVYLVTIQEHGLTAADDVEGGGGPVVVLAVALKGRVGRWVYVVRGVIM